MYLFSVFFNLCVGLNCHFSQFSQYFISLHYEFVKCHAKIAQALWLAKVEGNIIYSMHSFILMTSFNSYHTDACQSEDKWNDYNNEEKDEEN